MSYTVECRYDFSDYRHNCDLLLEWFDNHTLLDEFKSHTIRIERTNILVTYLIFEEARDAMLFKLSWNNPSNNRVDRRT